MEHGEKNRTHLLVVRPLDAQQDAAVLLQLRLLRGRGEGGRWSADGIVRGGGGDGANEGTDVSLEFAVGRSFTAKDNTQKTPYLLCSKKKDPADVRH